MDFRRLMGALVVWGVLEQGLAAEYFVSPHGSDTNPGSIEAPWRTLAKAGSSIAAGDVVYLRAGEYPERFILDASGTVEAPIVIQAFPDEEVSISGDGTAGPVVLFEATASHIVLDGVNVRFSVFPELGYFHNVAVLGAKHISLRNLRIVGAGDYRAAYLDGYWETGVYISNGAEYTTLENSEIRGMSLHAVSIGGIARFTHVHHNDLYGNAMNSITVGSSRYVMQGTLIEHNELGGSAFSDGIQTETDFSLSPEEYVEDTSSRGVIVRNNRIRDNAENAIDLKAAAHWVIDGNLIHGAQGNNDGGADGQDNRYGGLGIHRGAKRAAKDNIIRRNVVYDNSGGLLMLDGYKVYNNVFLNNRRDFGGSNSEYSEVKFPGFMGRNEGLSFFNNVVGDHRFEGVLIAAAGQALDNNLYFNSWQDARFLGWKQTGYEELDFEAWRAWLAADTHVCGVELGSRLIQSLPFVSPLDRVTGERNWDEFRIRPDSEAVDGGRTLTWATNAGSGSSELRVEDARFFSDGFGIAEGDPIRIGSQEAVVVEHIDYERHAITLATTASWSAGDPVTLPYEGSAPDIGAIEFMSDETAAREYGISRSRAGGHAPAQP